MFNLSGKVAFVTGASSGIGRASALALANQGAKVVVCGRRIDRLDALVSEIKTLPAGRQALAIRVDVTKKEEVQAAVTKTMETFGRLDILLNNAGVLGTALLKDISNEELDKTINTNIKGYFWAAQAASQEMAKNHWGRIINIASIASGGVGAGFPGISHYCASKGAVVAMTESWALELAKLGILVNAIGPGLIETEMTEGMLKDPKQMQGFTARIPLGRAGKAEEIAAVVAFLASEEVSYLTGATLYVDGGWLAS